MATMLVPMLLFPFASVAFGYKGGSSTGEVYGSGGGGYKSAYPDMKSLVIITVPSSIHLSHITIEKMSDDLRSPPGAMEPVDNDPFHFSSSFIAVAVVVLVVLLAINVSINAWNACRMCSRSKRANYQKVKHVYSSEEEREAQQLNV